MKLMTMTVLVKSKEQKKECKPKKTHCVSDSPLIILKLLYVMKKDMETGMVGQGFQNSGLFWNPRLLMPEARESSFLFLCYLLNEVL